MQRITFTVTNDLNYDQRMIRICSSLAANGFRVSLIGRKGRRSKPVTPQPFEQIRLFCIFRTGKLFYLEYNLRLFFYLLTCDTDIIGAIDLDTIYPCLLVSRLRGKKRVYDAHELFCEMKEIATRPFIYRCWKWVERSTVPEFSHGYTVNEPIAHEFEKMYGVQYEVIRNLPLLRPLNIPPKKEKFIIYQGAVNEGRSFETLIPAMKKVDARLLICGDGNFMEQARQLVAAHGLEGKVIFKGKLLPDELRVVTTGAWAGVTLFDAEGKSNYYSLANRFFDYIHAGLPQVCVDYPVYHELNNVHKIAVLIEQPSEDLIASSLNELLQNEALYRSLQENCVKARHDWNWQAEEKKLLAFYNNYLS